MYWNSAGVGRITIITVCKYTKNYLRLFTITSITMKTIEKVHVIPLGFERSVAVEPVSALGGVRAHIITVGGEFAEKYELSEKQRYFEKVVREDLENLGVEVEVHYADLFDFKMAVGEIFQSSSGGEECRKRGLPQPLVSRKACFRCLSSCRLVSRSQNVLRLCREVCE